MSEQSESQPFFTGQSSRHIRTAGGIDVFIFNLGLMSVGAAIGFNHFFGPASHPDASVFGQPS